MAQARSVRVVNSSKHIVLCEYNAGAVKWANDHFAEDFRRSKHIELKYHHVRGHIGAKSKETTKEMHADFLTKPLGGAALLKACTQVGIISTVRRRVDIWHLRDTVMLFERWLLHHIMEASIVW